LQFFRNPKRATNLNENTIIAPVDGKVVVIEEVEEPCHSSFHWHVN
jgi:phosphatidylserine decarboxylase